MLRQLGIIALIVYSALLLTVEYRTSQAYVRHYFTDISGPVVFYAVNTTLSVCLLWAAALVFLIHARLTKLFSIAVAARPFLWSQCLVFAWMGFDDRFQVHERVGYRLGIGDHYVLIVVALAQLMLLGFYHRVWRDCSAATRYLVIGAIMFAVMLFVDACVDHEMRLRLSVEDLCKTWATAALFMYAWELLSHRMGSFVRLSDEPVPMSVSNRTVGRSLELVD